jgi:hypothetical protein
MAKAGHKHLRVAAGVWMVLLHEGPKGAPLLSAAVGMKISPHLVPATDVVDEHGDRVGPDQRPYGGAHLVGHIGKKGHPAGHHVHFDHPIDDPDPPVPPTEQTQHRRTGCDRLGDRPDVDRRGGCGRH